jgi:transposase
VRLTAQQRKELLKLEKHMPHKGVAIRIRIILALDDGYAAKDIARILLLDEDTITKWKKLYEQSGTITDWLGTKNNGWQGRLTEEQEKVIKKYVTDKLITDCQQVVEYIENTLGISYTIDGVTKLLHRLGFVYKQVIGGTQ